MSPLTVVAEQQFCLIVFVDVNGRHQIHFVGVDMMQFGEFSSSLIDEIPLVLVTCDAKFRNKLSVTLRRKLKYVIIC